MKGISPTRYSEKTKFNKQFQTFGTNNKIDEVNEKAKVVVQLISQNIDLDLL